jgi:uncharacterized repeat protein (TIGR01451 family)
VQQLAGSPFLFNCSDAKDDRCTQPGPPLAYNALNITTGALNADGSISPSPPADLIADTDPFPAGESNPKDTLFAANIAKSLLPAGAVLVNVCSYPSAGSGGNNNPFDCILHPGDGLLVIKKVTTVQSAQVFDFTTTAGAGAYQLMGGQQTAPIGAVFGNTTSVSETVPGGWVLSGAACELEGGGASGTPGATGVTAITVQPGKITTCTFTNAPAPPDLTVVKDNDADHDTTFTDTETVPGNATYPYTVTYSVTISNAGSSAPATIDAIGDDKVTGDLVSAAKDPDCKDLLGTTLAGGASVTCYFDATFANADPGQVVNTASVTASNGGGPDTATDTSTVNLAQVKTIDLVKVGTLQLGADNKLNPGDKIHYEFAITNTGNVTLTGVDLDDALVGFTDATCGSTTLAPGASTNCTADYTVTQADIDAGSKTNSAKACGDPPTGAEVCDTDGTTTPLGQDKAIQLEKFATLDQGADNKLGVGDKIHYSFVITNIGNVTLTGVDLTDALVGFSDATCGATTLAPGATTNCTADYTLTQADIDAGTVTNTATACGDPPQGAEVCDDDTTTTTLNPDKGIQLVKSATLDLGQNGALNAGDKIHYSFVLTNVGNVTLTGVDLTDALVGFSDATCGATTLAPGASANCTADSTLTQADIDAGSRTNTATACGDPPAGAEVCDDDTTTTPLAPDKKIALDKTAVLNAPAAPKAGDTITYSFEITNTGNVTLTGVDLDDALVAFTNATCGATTLAPGAKTTCNVNYTLTQADIDAGSVSNSAHACGDPPAGAEVCGDDTTTTPLPADKRIELKKTGALQSQGTPKPGDKITYTFVITNTGNVTLSGVDLTDALVGLADAACGAATLAPGASANCTADYTITQADIDAGSVANTATACADPPQGAEVCDDDTTTVVLPQASSINVVKDGPATAFHGDKVTYTFKVTNPGNTTLSAVTVTDDKCAPLVGPAFAAGDNDALLEPGEEWRYTCTRTMPDHAAGETNPVVNTATATGSDPAGAPHTDTDTHSTALLHPAIQIVKAGPASAEAGQRVPYQLTVTNPGDVAIVGETLSVTDPLCDAPPLLAGKFRGDGADPTPDTLDPGDRWVYGCFAPTGTGQGQLINTAQVTGTPVGTTVDVHGVTDNDSVTTPLTQPKIQVLPETVVSGAAKLSGPSACVSKKFVARVAGKRIKSVTWFIDGKKVKTFTSKTGEAAKTTFSVDPGRYGKGVHRLQAKITFHTASRTPAKTLRMTFQRCARQVVAPQFTG